MTKIVILLLILGSVAWAVTPPTEDIMKIGVGARPMGMGKAFVAVADDGNSAFMNPAGLAGLKAWQFTSMYVNMLEGDVPYTVLSGSYPLKMGNLGFGLIATGTSSIPSPGPQTISYFDYYDRLFFLSYAADRGKGVSLGGNFKILSKGFTGSYTNTGLGFDFDLGLKYAHSKWLTLGANLMNILPTTVGWSTSAADDIPMLMKLGSAAKVWQERISLALDMDVSLGRSLPMLFHMGSEWPVNGWLTFRAGMDQIVSAANNVSTNPTAGVGFNFRGFKLDYAYHPYQETSLDIAHFVSFSYSPEIKPAKVITSEVKVAKPPLFKDVPDGYWAKEPIEALAIAGVISGYPDRTFRPEGQITHWAAPEIAAAKQAGILKYLGENPFEPKRLLTRAECAEMLYRLK